MSKRKKKRNYRKELKNVLQNYGYMESRLKLDIQDKDKVILKLRAQIMERHTSAIGQMLNSMGEGMHAMADALRTVNKQW